MYAHFLATDMELDDDDDDDHQEPDSKRSKT